ncbi:FecR family protein [Arenibacter amylolyticus]|uniref:FecR family protein n=1 Tax=Arenibacter amylolyticus TaxID=1406873 RepID=UPI000A3928C0|nr:FecR family protein [Arenibacter amylolyticus]
MSEIHRLKKILRAINNSESIDEIDLENLTKEERELLLKLVQEDMVGESLTFLADLDTDREWNKIKKQLAKTENSVIRMRKSVIRYAAVIVLLLALGIIISTTLGPDKKETVIENAVTLTIGEDDVKIIKRNGEQSIVTASGEIVGHQYGNKIIYTKEVQQDKLVYNELSIPNGELFELELSDGSLIHLNAGSKLRYPISFLSENNREVFIEGEGYFQVAEDRDHPFIVHTDGIAIEVLGTSFNVSNYKDNKQVETVLVEGSVQLYNPNESGSGVMLTPGYKASWDKNELLMEINEVSTELYTGWVKGELIFSDIAFRDMERKLERAFNVTIDNNNLMLAEKVLNAKFNKDVEDIEGVLKVINAIYPFSYKISGQQIIIN